MTKFEGVCFAAIVLGAGAFAGAFAGANVLEEYNIFHMRSSYTLADEQPTDNGLSNPLRSMGKLVSVPELLHAIRPPALPSSSLDTVPFDYGSSIPPSDLNAYGVRQCMSVASGGKYRYSFDSGPEGFSITCELKSAGSAY